MKKQIKRKTIQQMAKFPSLPLQQQTAVKGGGDDDFIIDDDIAGI